MVGPLESQTVHVTKDEWLRYIEVQKVELIVVEFDGTSFGHTESERND